MLIPSEEVRTLTDRIGLLHLCMQSIWKVSRRLQDKLIIIPQYLRKGCPIRVRKPCTPQAFTSFKMHISAHACVVVSCQHRRMELIDQSILLLVVAQQPEAMLFFPAFMVPSRKISRM